MTLIHLPFTTPSTDPAEVPAPSDPRVIARFDAVDDRLATMDERLDLILLRGKGLLDEIVKLGQKVDGIVAATEERAR